MEVTKEELLILLQHYRTLHEAKQSEIERLRADRAATEIAYRKVLESKDAEIERLRTMTRCSDCDAECGPPQVFCRECTNAAIQANREGL